MSDPTLSIRRDLLPRPVRSYADNLTAQLHAIWKQYDVKTLDDFNRLAQEKKIPGQVVRQYKDLITRLSLVVRSGKIPESDKQAYLEHRLIEAKDLLGEQNVFGPEQITKAWNIDLDPEDIPTIQYSTQDLEKAKQLNEILILRINTDGEGHPLTIRRIQELTDSNLPAGQQKTFYDFGGNPWYKSEPFFTTETPSLKWALISPDLLPNTTDKNYLNQTLTLRDYLKQHNLLTPEEEAELDPTTVQNLRKLIDTDWKQAAETLSNLKINQKHRRSASEAVYDTLLRFLIIGERPLPDRYDWTRSRSFDGYLVYVVYLKSVGLKVNGHGPQYRSDNLGACLAR